MPGFPESSWSAWPTPTFLAVRRLPSDMVSRPLPNPHPLLDQVEAVSIAVPTSAHHMVVEASLRAGAHVLVEKPIAVTHEEALALVELAKQQARILQVGHIERFNPAIRALAVTSSSQASLNVIGSAPLDLAART